jgi:hypothetical protein
MGKAFLASDVKITTSFFKTQRKAGLTGGLETIIYNREEVKNVF